MYFLLQMLNAILLLFWRELFVEYVSQILENKSIDLVPRRNVI